MKKIIIITILILSALIGFSQFKSNQELLLNKSIPAPKGTENTDFDFTIDYGDTLFHYNLYKNYTWDKWAKKTNLLPIHRPKYINPDFELLLTLNNKNFVLYKNHTWHQFIREIKL